MANKFPDKTPSEIKLCAFDFAKETADGATLATPSVTKTLAEGTDTNAATLTLGTPDVDGTVLKVLVGAGTDANKYKLLATVEASNGERHQLSAMLVVKTSAA